jgi:cell division initiation protein
MLNIKVSGPAPLGAADHAEGDARRDLEARRDAAPLPEPTESRRLPSPDRTMPVSPLDLRQAKFRTGLRGLDRGEVEAFLLEAAGGYEQALRENERLRQDVVLLEGSLNQYRELEGSLKTTLMSAQKIADDMRENAAQESTRLVREAEGRAELIVQRAQARADDVQREIDALRLKRREAEVNLESLISVLHNTLDFVREQEQRDLRMAKVGPVASVA